MDGIFDFLKQLVNPERIIQYGGIYLLLFVVFKDSTLVKNMKSNFLDIKHTLDSLTIIEIEKLSRLDSINNHWDKPNNNNSQHKKTGEKVSS